MLAPASPIHPVCPLGLRWELDSLKKDAVSGSCVWTDSARGEGSGSSPARQGRPKHSQGQRRSHADPCPQPRASFLVSSSSTAANAGVLTQTWKMEQGGGGGRAPVTGRSQSITILDPWSQGVFFTPGPADGQTECREGKGLPRFIPAVKPVSSDGREINTENNESPGGRGKAGTKPLCHQV